MVSLTENILIWFSLMSMLLFSLDKTSGGSLQQEKSLGYVQPGLRINLGIATLVLNQNLSF